MMRKTGESEDEFVVNEADDINDDGEKDSDSGNVAFLYLIYISKDIHSAALGKRYTQFLYLKRIVHLSCIYELNDI